MDKKLTADLNVIANSGLEIELLNGDLNIIQKLDDEPNDVGGLTSAQLKAKFDESGNIIKEYINKTLVPAVLSEDATEASRKAAEAQREANETARQAAEQARAAAEQGRASAESERETAETQRKTAEASRQSAEQARADENTGIVARATAQANAAAGSAASAAGSASTAREDARTASGQAATAVGAASSASASEAAAAQSSASASNASMAAQSWAVGGTGTRTGEDTNNAKYWAGQAQAVVGGDFATKAEAQGYVDTHNQSAEAHSDIRTALATHAAQHATGGSDPLTPGDIGAAPDGYGLGGSCWNDHATTVADLDEAVQNGWYQIASNALNTPPAFSNYYPDAGMMFVSAGGYTVYQRYLSYSPAGVPFYREAIRYARVSGGVYKFTDWEYVNPLLNVGVEYRTTERYKGKPVYTQLLNLGNAPAKGTVKTIDFPPNSENQRLVWAQLTYYGITFPYYNDDSIAMYIYIGQGSQKIYIHSPGDDRSDHGQIEALLKYTKSTD